MLKTISFLFQSGATYDIIKRCHKHSLTHETQVCHRFDNNFLDSHVMNQSRLSHISVHSTSVGGVMVSMVAFQAVDPGSIPGRRSFVEL